MTFQSRGMAVKTGSTSLHHSGATLLKTASHSSMANSTGLRVTRGIQISTAAMMAGPMLVGLVPMQVAARLSCSAVSRLWLVRPTSTAKSSPMRPALPRPLPGQRLHLPDQLVEAQANLNHRAPARHQVKVQAPPRSPPVVIRQLRQRRIPALARHQLFRGPVVCFPFLLPAH